MSPWTPSLLRILRSSLTPGDPSNSILPFISRPVRWFFVLLLLVNVRGLPFFWTVRVFRPAIYARIKYRFWSIVESRAKVHARLREMSPVGANPFTTETVFTTRATPDASDFNWHLSNSSYAASLDMARFKYFVAHMPLLYVDGGWAALGGTHYSFIREIPLNSRYEIRLSVASWDNKWIYLIAKYVTFPSKNQKSKPLERYDANSHVLRPAVTPIDSATASPSRTPAPIVETPGLPLPQDAVLHCTAISKLCCKIGRITIPPAVAMATSGFCISLERFEYIQKLRIEDGGSRIKQFYAGGWRDVPKGDRWWEEAFGGAIEQRRGEGLKSLAASVGFPVPDLDV